MTEEIEINELELFESLLDANWDSIEDLPEFCVPPIGDYMVRIKKCELGTNKDKTEGAIKLIGSIEEVIELANPEDVAPLVGSLVGAQYQGKLGISRFKKDYAATAEALGANGPRELIDMLGDAVVAVTFKHRADREKVDPNTGKPVVYAEWATIVPA